MIERRKHVRVRSSHPVRFRDLGHAASVNFSETSALDISEGGVRFRADRFLPLNNKLLIEMTLSPGQRPVKSIAKPAWTKAASGFYECEVGVFFVDIAEEDRLLVRNHVTKQLGIPDNLV